MIHATARLAISVVVVISPQPDTPSSVRTSTKKYSPHPEPDVLTSQGTSLVIFTSRSSRGLAPDAGPRALTAVTSRSYLEIDDVPVSRGLLANAVQDRYRAKNGLEVQ